jgi:hypothetical protein
VGSDADRGVVLLLWLSVTGAVERQLAIGEAWDAVLQSPGSGFGSSVAWLGAPAGATVRANRVVVGTNATRAHVVTLGTLSGPTSSAPTITSVQPTSGLPQAGGVNVEAVGQHEGALELPRGDATVEVIPLFVVLLFAADRKLLVFQGNFQLVPREPGHGERDAHRSRSALLDIVGGIGLGRRALGPVDQGAGVVEAQQEGTVEQDCTRRHHASGPRSGLRLTAPRKRRGRAKRSDGDGTWPLQPR